MFPGQSLIIELWISKQGQGLPRLSKQSHSLVAKVHWRKVVENFNRKKSEGVNSVHEQMSALLNFCSALCLKSNSQIAMWSLPERHALCPLSHVPSSPHGMQQEHGTNH